MHREERRYGGRRRYPGVSVLVLDAVVDVFLDLGHIVVVLAQVRGVLDKLVVFFVDLRPVLVFILGVAAVRLIIAGFGDIVGLGGGIHIVFGNLDRACVLGFGFLLQARRAFRLDRGGQGKGSAALRALDVFFLEVVKRRAAILADPFLAPCLISHPSISFGLLF